MNRELVQQVWQRAAGRCEYCRIPYPQYRLPFQIDHIRARQHGGPTTSGKLALACYHCNRHKGPNPAGWDSETQQLIRLFHPRTDNWREPFEGHGAEIVGRTSAGRVTMQVLAMNADGLLLLRVELFAEGVALF